MVCGYLVGICMAVLCGVIFGTIMLIGAFGILLFVGLALHFIGYILSIVKLIGYVKRKYETKFIKLVMVNV